MARQTTNALKYYSRDTRQQENEQYIEAVHGPVGFYIVEKLRMHIYGCEQGYYCDFSDFHKRLFCMNNCKISIDDLNAVIDSCFLPEVGLFDREMYEKHKILTSDGIQKRWLKIVEECNKKNKVINADYNLLDKVEVKVNSAGTLNGNSNVSGGDLIPDESLLSGDLIETKGVLSSEEMPQTKLNETKLNETNEREGAKSPPVPPENLKSGGKQPVKKKFEPPGEVEAVDYFLTATKSVWRPELARLQAKKFMAHYVSNGWKQNGNKAIVDWQAAANGWLLREMGSDFSITKGVVTKKQMNAVPASGHLADLKKEVEYLYQRFLEDQLKQELLKPEHYQTLKVAGMAEFDEETRQTLIGKAIQIRINDLTGCNERSKVDLLMAYTDKKPITTEPIKSDSKNLYRAMEYFAIMHIFEMAKSAGRLCLMNIVK